MNDSKSRHAATRAEWAKKSPPMFWWAFGSLQGA